MRRMGIWLFSGGLVTGGLLGWLIRFPPNDSSSAASWVQAVGTIAAIIASVQLVRWQFLKGQEAAANADRDRLKQRVEVIRQVADEACSLVQFLESNTASDEIAMHYFATAYDLRGMYIVQASLDAIPTWDLPSADLVMPVILLRKSLAKAVESANQIASLIANDDMGIGLYTSSDSRDAIVEQEGIANYAMGRIDDYAARYR